MAAITTDRTFLRTFYLDDIDELMIMMSDHEVMKHTGFQRVYDKSESKEKLKKWTTQKDVWAVIHTQTNKLCGWFMLVEQEVGVFEIGYMMAQNFWGQGLCQEVGKAVIDYGFKSKKAKKIIAKVNNDNLASIHVLEKWGLKTVSTQESQLLLSLASPSQ